MNFWTKERELVVPEIRFGCLLGLFVTLCVGLWFIPESVTQFVATAAREQSVNPHRDLPMPKNEFWAKTEERVRSAVIDFGAEYIDCSASISENMIVVLANDGPDTIVLLSNGWTEGPFVEVFREQGGLFKPEIFLSGSAIILKVNGKALQFSNDKGLSWYPATETTETKEFPPLQIPEVDELATN